MGVSRKQAGKRSRASPAVNGSKKRKSEVNRENEKEDDALVDEFLMDEDSDDGARKSSSEDEDPYAGETPEERRVRMAREFLSRVEKLESANADSDAEEGREGVDEEDAVQKHLQTEVYKARGTLHRRLAHQVSASDINSSSVRFLRGHRKTGTCVVLSNDESRAYSGAKDGSYICWDVETGSKLAIVQASQKELLCAAISCDGNMLAIGGRDNAVRLFDTRSNTESHCLKHHKDAITSLAFRHQSSTLFSGSMDRCVKVWDVSHPAYIDTLFGHQSPVTSIASLKKERVLSCGLDGTLRLFKVPEETQLVYRSNCVNVDAVAMVSEAQFLSGAQDGSISLWRAGKKKAIGSIRAAHGVGNWINTLSACAYTDLVASGSNDGIVRLWQIEDDRMTAHAQIPVPGFVNGLSFGNSGRIVAAAVGAEPRLGRWKVEKKAKSGIAIIALGDNTLNEQRQEIKSARADNVDSSGDDEDDL